MNVDVYIKCEKQWTLANYLLSSMRSYYLLMLSPSNTIRIEINSDANTSHQFYYYLINVYHILDNNIVEIKNMDNEVDYAGISKRIIAYIIDANLFKATIFTLSCFLLVFPAFTTHSLYDYLFSKTVAQDISDAVAVIYITIAYIVNVTFSILMIVKLGGTAGQLLLGMRVKDKNTLENITVVQAIKRALSFKILDFTVALYHISAWFLILVILIDIFLLLRAVQDECKQAFHDKIANTVVINYRSNCCIYY